MFGGLLKFFLALLTTLGLSLSASLVANILALILLLAAGDYRGQGCQWKEKGVKVLGLAKLIIPTSCLGVGIFILRRALGPVAGYIPTGGDCFFG